MEKDEKVYFIQRFIAFLIDLFIVSLVTSLLASPFIDQKKMDELGNHSLEMTQKYLSDEIDVNTYTAEAINVQYEIAYMSGLQDIIGIILGLVYFVILPLYYNGQTLGKRLMKIRISSREGKLSANQLIFRSFIANSILLNILSVVFILFASRNTYFYCIGLFSLIQYGMMIASFFLVACGKKGLAVHDYLAHTKVIKC